jgi:hypothetical protein
MEFRLPLAGSYNTRIAETSSLSSVSGIVGSGIVGAMVVGRGSGTSTKDRRFVNCFTETVNDNYNQTKTLYLVKRPGFAALNTPQAGSVGNAILVWTGQGLGTKVISAFGATNSSIYDGTTRLVTNNSDTTVITGKVTGITETSISQTATLVISSSDNTAWHYQDAGTVTKITDADFPGNNGLTLAGTFAHLNGKSFIMDTNGGIWGSDINSVTSWGASNVIYANSYPDGGVGVVRKGPLIMGFGKETTQFFEDAGNPSGSPLRRIEAMTVKVGCVGAKAITQLSNDIYWAGSSPEGGLAIYSYGDAIKRISKPEIDRIILLAGAANISLSAVKMYGRSFVIVNASTVTFVYCVDEDEWHQWTSIVPLWSKCSAVSSGSEQVTYSISTVSTSGKVYIVNPSNYTFQDDGNTYTATAQTGLFGKGNKRMSFWECELIADRENSSSPMTIAATDDDYQNTAVFGTVDLMDARPRLNRLGSAYRRSWILSHSANTPFRIEAMTVRTSESVN